MKITISREEIMVLAKALNRPECKNVKNMSIEMKAKFFDGKDFWMTAKDMEEQMLKEEKERQRLAKLGETPKERDYKIRI